MKTLTIMMKKVAILITLLSISVTIIYSQESVGNNRKSPLERFNKKDYTSFIDYIQKNAFFPPDAFNNLGVLLTGFTLSSDGKLVNVFNLNSLSPMIDNQILDLIESTNGCWSSLPDSVTLRKNQIVIISIVYCLKDTEYKIHKDNFKLNIENNVELTALVGGEQMSPPNYTRTKSLRNNLEKQISKAKYVKAREILIELLKREPLNSEYYSELSSIENSLGNKEAACNYLKFVNKYLIEQPKQEIVDKIECK